ncbi:MAG: endopeptidase La [Rickettsiales bacterium]|jgi:ATP-dependent Lon protease|nr:endopeptidase La [Rickettsiales bacterium]
MKDKKFAVLPLRDVVVYPGMILPLFIGRDSSVKALQASLDANKSVCLATQKNSSSKEEITACDIYDTGVLCNVLQFLKLPDNTVKILIEAKSSVKLENIEFKDGVMEAVVSVIENIDDIKNSSQIKSLLHTLCDSFIYYAKISRKVPNDIIETLRRNDDMGVIVDTVLNYVDIDIKTQQEILELPLTAERLERFITITEQQIATFKLDQKIQNRVKFQLDKNQKDFYLNEKMKAISKELGEDADDFSIYEEKLKKIKLSKEAYKKVKSEISKVKKMPSMSAETTVIRNYLDWVLDLPWNKKSKVSHDIENAKKILDEDHYGLEKVKERIIQNLIVQKRTQKTAPTILCLYGPPGVGKTSLGQSIARAMERKFDRISLAGVGDDSALRGHRRTYIGSQPGRIIATMKKVGTSNPLIMLDEVDKMVSSWHGDPASVLLEVLDPAQNKNFTDHYLELEYDLSDVMFITTANSLNIPAPLRDRMEIINIEGYVEDEKLQIAKKHLLPKIMKANGVKEKEIEFADDAIVDVIRYYTMEAGVRSLDRMLSKIVRKSIMEIESKHLDGIVITKDNLKELAGVRIFEKDETAGNTAGVVNGLGWTEYGGAILPLESVFMYGKGNIMITGSLGDVMKESAQAARSYVKSRAIALGIHPSSFDKYDIHIHAPEGAIPKDGPSAGLAFATVLVSLLTGIPVKSDVAMTGEINLQGKALAIGGLKQKLLAAKRAGMKTVIIPEKNLKDLEEIPDTIKESLDIRAVKSADEVFEIALSAPIVPLKWDAKIEAAYLNSKGGGETKIGVM